MVRYIENSGASEAEAVIIQGALDETEGVAAEYAYLDRKLGTRGKDWELEMQAVGERGGRRYDVLTVKLRDGGRRDIYFDITDFYGKS